MKKRYIAFICLIIHLSSCKEQNTDPKQEIDYILFGHFYGFCVGEECIEIFKLTNDGLYEDTLDRYPNADKVYEGNFTKLDNDKFMLVNSILDSIPQELLNEKNNVIGAPDASDGGGVYFAIKDKDGIKFWLIDQFDHNLPAYLIPFKDQINSLILKLNK